MGVPIGWPNGRIFGTICVRDNKRNEYSEAYLKLLLHFRDMLQADLKSLARLHGEIEEREAKIRRLVDANIIGIIIWDDREGRILEANDAFLRMGGYDREDLISGRLNRTDLTPAEWRERDARTDAELKMIGAVTVIASSLMTVAAMAAPARPPTAMTWITMRTTSRP